MHTLKVLFLENRDFRISLILWSKSFRQSFSVSTKKPFYTNCLTLSKLHCMSSTSNTLLIKADLPSFLCMATCIIPFFHNRFVIIQFDSDLLTCIKINQPFLPSNHMIATTTFKIPYLGILIFNISCSHEHNWIRVWAKVFLRNFGLFFSILEFLSFT